MLRIKPSFDYPLSSTLFSTLECWAVWDDSWNRYKFASVYLEDWPISPSGFGPDRRRKKHALRVDFIEFAQSVRSAVIHYEKLVQLRDKFEVMNAAATIRISNDLILSTEGIFLKAWKLKPIVNLTANHVVVTKAILDLLQLEKELPDKIDA